MRSQNSRPVFFWLGVLVLTVLLAGLASGSMVLPGGPPPTPTGAPRPTPAPAPPVPAVQLSDTRGFVATAGADAPAALRRETSAETVGSLRGQAFIGAVSGTGRRVAYWVTTAGGTRELRVFDVVAADQDTTLATLHESERGAAVLWSSDRTGLLLVVESSGRPGTGDPPGPFSALRVIDTPTRAIREIARLSDGSQYWPVGWDRASRLTGACITAADGTAIAYAVVGEDALNARTPMEPGIPARTVHANGTEVLGVMNGTVIRVWTIASYGDHRELGANPGERIASARWKPGGSEIVVAVAGRLELWPAGGGDRRVIARGLPEARDLLVSADAALAVVTFDGGRSAIAVDLATGRTGPVPMSGEQLVASISFR